MAICKFGKGSQHTVEFNEDGECVFDGKVEALRDVFEYAVMFPDEFPQTFLGEIVLAVHEFYEEFEKVKTTQLQKEIA
jgi:hypothetical protein